VVTPYRVTRLDMEVEARSLDRRAAITRRSDAIRLLRDWAARTHRTVQVIFTLGVESSGLPGTLGQEAAISAAARRPKTADAGRGGGDQRSQRSPPGHSHPANLKDIAH
jgi:hypothetical protein